jgi:CRISPR/Cas system endoribonuclease Cas6 (RAMP superfamily)
MRISITFSVPYGSSIPVNYNHILTGLIYRLAGVKLRNGCETPRTGFQRGRKTALQVFTFSQLFGGPGSAKVESGRLIFTTDTLRWTFGSCLPVLSTVLMDALLSAGTVNIGGMEAKVTSVNAEQRKEFFPRNSPFSPPFPPCGEHP